MRFLNYLQNWVRGTRIVSTHKWLERSDFWTREQIEEYQLIKLQKIVKFSYEHVPYYHQLFDRIGLKPEDIHSLKDIEKIPLLTKEIIRKERQNFLAKNVNTSSRKIKCAFTGGTTGIPLIFYKNTQTRDFTWGAYYRWYNWMDITPGDREAVFWIAPTVLSKNRFKQIKRKIISKMGNALFFDSFNLNEKTIPIVAERIIKFQPILIRGYLSAIFQLASYFKEHNLKIYSLKAISTTTETLLPMYREYIEDVFGVKMYDQYGCGECNSIAFECPAHQGLHITEEHCILEILDKNGKSCINQPGSVTVTDLDNYAFPFLRYINGDTAIMKDKECTCGRHSKQLKSIYGRTIDLIYLKNGNGVSGPFFTDIFHELGFNDFKYFTRFQIVQKKKGDFICRLEKTHNLISDKDIELIRTTLGRYGNDVQIEIMDHLPHDRSGKFRYLLSEIQD